jgi:hypothetical protein
LTGLGRRPVRWRSTPVPVGICLFGGLLQVIPAAGQKHPIENQQAGCAFQYRPIGLGFHIFPMAALLSRKAMGRSGAPFRLRMTRTPEFLIPAVMPLSRGWRSACRNSSRNFFSISIFLLSFITCCYSFLGVAGLPIGRRRVKGPLGLSALLLQAHAAPPRCLAQPAAALCPFGGFLWGAPFGSAMVSSSG